MFWLAKQICAQFMSVADFERRRLVWVALTVAAFLSPDFWVFAAVAFPLVYWAGRRDAHPVALFLLLLHVVPPNVGAELPAFGINRLFGINGYRLLTIAILLPLAWDLWRSREGKGRLAAVDLLLLGYGLLQLVLFIPYEAFTNTMRRGFLFWLDVFVLVYAVSRGCRDAKALADAMASYCLALAVLAPIALFESGKAWLLYDGIA